MWYHITQLDIYDRKNIRLLSNFVFVNMGNLSSKRKGSIDISEKSKNFRDNQIDEVVRLHKQKKNE